MSKFLVLAIVSIVCLFNCKSQQNLQKGNNDILEMKLVLRGDYSSFEEEGLFKIDEKSEFEDFFGKINKTRKPGIPIPNIDFKTNSVIIRLKGKSTNNEPDISLGKSSKEILFFKKRKISSKSPNTAVMTPFFIYSIPKTDKRIKIQ